MCLQDKFNKFHAESPHIYESFKQVTFDVLTKALPRGVQFISPDMVGHIMRYQSWSKPDGEDYKVNNNWISYYARLFKKEHTEHGHYFKTRKTDSEKAEAESPAYLS